MENSGVKTYRKFGEKPLPKNVFGPPTYDTFPPPFFGDSLSFPLKERGTDQTNGHQPQFLRPPKVVLESTLCSTFSPSQIHAIRFAPPPQPLPKFREEKSIHHHRGDPPFFFCRLWGSMVYTLLSRPMVYTLFPCFPRKMVYTIAFFALWPRGRATDREKRSPTVVVYTLFFPWSFWHCFVYTGFAGRTCRDEHQGQRAPVTSAWPRCCHQHLGRGKRQNCGRSYDCLMQGWYNIVRWPAS